MSGFYSGEDDLQDLEFVYREQVALAFEQRQSTLELIKTAAQINASVADSKVAKPLIRKLFEIFEAGKLEKVQKHSDKEDEKLREFAKSTFEITLGGGANTLQPKHN